MLMSGVKVFILMYFDGLDSFEQSSERILGAMNFLFKNKAMEEDGHPLQKVLNFSSLQLN